jgi:hypothetical protein
VCRRHRARNGPGSDWSPLTREAPAAGIRILTCGFLLSERVTGIEPVLPAWESSGSPRVLAADLRLTMIASDRCAAMSARDCALVR